MKIEYILQPIVGPGEDNVLSYEALLPRENVRARANVPKGNVQAHFNDLEDNGYIKQANVKQLKHVLKLLKKFPDRISVNLSMQTLNDETYLKKFLKLCGRAHHPSEAN